MRFRGVLVGGVCFPLGLAVGWLLDRLAEEPVAQEPLPRVEAVDRSPEPTLGPSELLALGRIEDLILVTFEDVYRRWQEDPEDPELLEQKRLREEEYRTFLRLSDHVVEQAFPPEVVDATLSTDLLAGDRAAQWIGASLPGFEYRIENGVLHMIGPAPEAAGEGIISIGDREQWRDLVLDIEFTLVKGECSLFLRLPRVYQENVQNINLSSEEDGYYEAGVSHELSVSLIGSTQLEEDVVEGSMGPFKTNVSWTQVRKGALGISLPKNSEVRFTRLRAKILR